MDLNPQIMKASCEGGFLCMLYCQLFNKFILEYQSVDLLSSTLYAKVRLWVYRFQICCNKCSWLHINETLKVYNPFLPGNFHVCALPVPCRYHACAIIHIEDITPGYNVVITSYKCGDIQVITSSYLCDKLYGTSMVTAWQKHGNCIE